MLSKFQDTALDEAYWYGSAPIGNWGWRNDDGTLNKCWYSMKLFGDFVKAAKAKGYVVEGPFPSDTVFLRAKNGDFDAVLTMYHDQGQIAMKLMGFDRGVTLIGGFPDRKSVV